MLVPSPETVASRVRERVVTGVSKVSQKESTPSFVVPPAVVMVQAQLPAGVKPGSKDTWDGFPEEREEIFKWIADQRIEGVFIIAADRHRSDAWKNDRPGAYPLFEFQSSKLTNIHTHPVLKRSLFGYNKKCSFGLLTFDTSAKDPSVTYDVINIDNEKMHSITIRKSQLGFK